MFTLRTNHRFPVAGPVQTFCSSCLFFLLFIADYPLEAYCNSSAKLFELDSNWPAAFQMRRPRSDYVEKYEG